MTLKEWRDDFIQKAIDLAEDCEIDTDLELPTEDFRWAKEDIRKLKDLLVQTCPENLSESQGGEGPEDAPFNDEWFERFDKGHWSQGVVDSLTRAIERGCCDGCCWTIFADVNVNFVGNLTENPQTIFLTTPAACDASEEVLAEMLSAALVADLAEKMQVIEGLEGFSIEAAGNFSASSSPGGPDCDVSFFGPAIES
jgi:hypothetical protein